MSTTSQDEHEAEAPAASRTEAPVPGAADGRRLAVARAITGLLRRAIADPAVLDLVLDETDFGRATALRPEPRPGGVTVVIRGPDALARLLFPPTPDGFAEAYLRGDIDIAGDVMAAVGAGQALDLRRLGARRLARLLRWTLELRRGVRTAAPLGRVARVAGPRHSRARDMAAVRFHYDVGNEFYELWLDRRLTYSCAYFADDTTPGSAADRLDDAQDAKLDLIARKLRLAPGDRLLDIGCGWGSLIGVAAERYGADAIGVTLSEKQATEANVRAAAAGVDERARALVLDYRDLSGLGAFDAVASVGMFEHVGRDNLATYFRSAFDALRPGGLFLNHGIATAEPPRFGRGPDARPRTGRFIDRYVFPDGELVTVEEAVARARAAGFEVLDVQSLRRHYALTLAAWIARLEAQWTQAVAAAGEEVARTWRLYMSGARLGFERGELDVCQLLLAKPGRDGRLAVPLRPWW
jgi:cyclopropane-fatty-acyl-phospholipid synthase